MMKKIWFYCVFFSLPAMALNVQLLRPTGDQYEGFSVHGTSTPKAGTFEVGGVYQYVSNPIDYKRFNISNSNAVNYYNSLDAYFNLGFFDWFSIGVLVPINLVTDVESFNNISQQSDFSLGDLYLHATLRLTNNEKGLGVAVVPFFSLPLDVDSLDQFNDKAPSAGGYLVVDRHISGRHYFAVNLGGKFRFEEESILGSAYMASHEFLYGLSYVFHLDPEKNIDIFVEGQGRSNFKDFFTQEETMPMEALGGLRARVFDQKLSMTLGGGKGLSDAFGSPDFRAFFGLSYSGDRESKSVAKPTPAPVIPEKPVVAAPVVVKEPAKVSQLYVMVRDEDKQLIPVEMTLRDNNGETIATYSGTTWRKNVSPGEYKLSIAKEGYEDIEKSMLLKLRKRHTYTLKLKTAQEQKEAPVEGSKIEFLGRIQFNSGKATIRPESYQTLNQVAEILKKYPQIELLRVEAYTDSTGSDSINLKLSQQRALSVKSFLLGMGIAQERLSAIGLGESQPIADNATAEGRAKNRRVEFTVVKASSVQGLKIKK